MADINQPHTLPRSAATLAMLKALHDSGKDHIEMFQPFVLHAVASLPTDDFVTADLQPVLEQVLGLKVPLETLQTLLTRAVHRNQVRRDGGRYFRNTAALEGCNIEPLLAAYVPIQQALCQALQRYAADQGLSVDEEEAWHLLIALVQSSHLGLLLEGDVPAFDNQLVPSREAQIVARFVQDRCQTTPALADALRGVVEGYVLQNTLLLRDIATLAGLFRNLRVFFDTRFLFDLLGVSGAPALTAARESLELIRSAGARLASFETTIREMRRVLALYENRLGTNEGRLSLHPTPLSRFFLTNRWAPSDVRELSALLDSKLKQLGVTVVEMPQRRAAFTLDEAALGVRLRKPADDHDNARVQHDVDCVAAVLVLRAGRPSQQLEQAREIFCTTTGLVVKNVNQWFREQGETGVPPTIYQASLSSRAWLKKPAVASDVKLHEIIAVCAAILRPRMQVWDAFGRHLKRMKDTGEISSDEAVAIVANEFTDIALNELDWSEGEPDSSSIAEVVERVKARYREEGEAKAANVEAAASEKIAELERSNQEAMAAAEEKAAAVTRQLQGVHNRVDRLAGRVARVASWSVFLVIAGAIVWGTWFSAGDWGSRLAAGVVILMTLAGYFWGTHVEEIREGVERRVKGWITGWFVD